MSLRYLQEIQRTLKILSVDAKGSVECKKAGDQPCSVRNAEGNGGCTIGARDPRFPIVIPGKLPFARFHVGITREQCPNKSSGQKVGMSVLFESKGRVTDPFVLR